MKKTPKFIPQPTGRIWFQVILTMDVPYDWSEKPDKEYDIEDRRQFREDKKCAQQAMSRHYPSGLAATAKKYRDPGVLNFQETEKDDEYPDWGTFAVHRKWCFDLDAKDFFRLMLDGSPGYVNGTCDTMGALTDRGHLPAYSLDYEVGYGNEMMNAYVSPLIWGDHWWGGELLDAMWEAFSDSDWDWFKALAEACEDDVTDKFPYLHPEVFPKLADAEDVEAALFDFWVRATNQPTLFNPEPEPAVQ